MERLTGNSTNTVNNYCPEDCRFRTLLVGDTYNYPVWFCDYGRIAYDEGKSEVPMRGGSIEECTVYEKQKKKKSNRVPLVINYKSSKRYKENEKHDEENL